MALARNIRYLRKKQGWGQEELAEKLGYKSYTTIQKWESGVSEPPLKTVHVLAEMFGVDIADLTNTDLEFAKAPTDVGEREMSDAELKFALWGDCEDVSDEDLADVRRYAAFVRERKKDQK